jgi:hypothetical protein
MPWYKLRATHGPGHQSTHEEYFYTITKLTKEFKQDEWIERTEHLDYPIGDIKEIKFLPEDIKLQKIERCLAKIKAMNDMLKILENTPSK